MNKELKAPFPYAGGKSTVADMVWDALGSPAHYIEPFFGSGAVLLARPNYEPTSHIESVCDKDGFLANVWRALQHDPDAVAKWCDWPVLHCDLSARKRRLIANEARLLENLTADDEWYNAKLAGYWIWAASCWIGSGLTFIGKIPHVSDGGKGVHAIGKIPHVSDGGKGVQEPYNTNIYAWFRRLSERLRSVRVVCGDWTRVCGGNWQDKTGTCGIFMDPPYSVTDRDTAIYHHDDTEVAKEVAKWCLERGKRPSYRIVLAGYVEEHHWLTEHGWREETWSAQGGYANTARQETTQGKENRHREALWYSPYTVPPESVQGRWEL